MDFPKHWRESLWNYPSPTLDNIRLMVIVWRLGGNIIRTALCWIVWHNVHSLQHTYMSSSYRSNRLGLSHWNPYAVHRGGCLELYYCNMVEWFWWDSSLIFDDQLVSFSALWDRIYRISSNRIPQLVLEQLVSDPQFLLESRDPVVFETRLLLGPPDLLAYNFNLKV